MLGHPFGKVPPPIAFDGCTSNEAEIIMNDPANPVGKRVLAGVYVTDMYVHTHIYVYMRRHSHKVYIGTTTHYWASSEVSSFQALLSRQMWHLGQTKVSCLWRFPQFRGVLIERGSTVHTCMEDVHCIMVSTSTQLLVIVQKFILMPAANRALSLMLTVFSPHSPSHLAPPTLPIV